MKAIIQRQYGSPDVLQMAEVQTPAPRNDQVLIRIHAATLTATDVIFRRGRPLVSRSATGFLKPKRSIPGDGLAGVIEDVGSDVTLYRKGDQVFGSTGAGFGAHAEYLCLAENSALAKKPSTMSFAEAVSLSDGALTALPFLRDEARLQAGQKILIIGASGSIGTAAVQLARYFGAVVTGVCSTSNVELVKSLGATEVVDYTKEDFTRSGKTYDVIFDAVGKNSFARCKSSLVGRGIYLSTVLTGAVLWDQTLTSMIGKKKAKIAFTGLRSASDRARDLLLLSELFTSGKLRAVIDRTYPLDRIGEAHRYVEQGHKRGNVILAMERDDRR